nr:hypothetical protein [Tanacetum cinerariifolium]
RTGANILVLDNITALALKTTADADVSIGIMKGLKRLQQERGVSSLILAHTPKIPIGAALTLNHLAGSKHLSNFADSVFFIGRSAQGSSIRYIKQVKNRMNEVLQGVVVCELHDEAGYLDFSLVGPDEEINHLAATEGKISTPRKAPLSDVLAVIPAMLAQPLSAGQLEIQLSTRFDTDVRTIRKRLKELIDTNAQFAGLNGQVYTLTKEHQGRENCYNAGLVKQPGAPARGLATAASAPPLYQTFGLEPAYVWPRTVGTQWGVTIEPLYPQAPAAVQVDAQLYALLALTDALRLGRPRE